MAGCCCFARKSKKSNRKQSEPAKLQVVPPSDRKPPQHHSDPISKPNFQAKPKPHLQLPAVKEPHNYSSPHVLISTYYEETDITKMELTPRGTIKKKVCFNCPICMDYFNLVLVTACCGNYICHRCAKSMLDSSLAFEIRCPHCNADPLILGDVDLSKSVKMYSDSFANPKTKKATDPKPLSTIPERESSRRDSYDLDRLEVKDSPRGMDDSEVDNRV
jgi:superfamily II helicase